MHRALAVLTVWMGHLVGAQPLLRHLIVPSDLPDFVERGFIHLYYCLTLGSLDFILLPYFTLPSSQLFPKNPVSFLRPLIIQEDLETTSSRRSSRRPMHDQALLEHPVSTEYKFFSLPISSLCVSNGLQKGPNHRDGLLRGMMVHDWLQDDPSISAWQGCY